MAKFISTVVFNNSSLAALKNDPEAGRKLFDAIQATMTGGDTKVECGGQIAALAVESHLEDQTRLIAVSGAGARDLGAAGGTANMAEGSERALFEACTANYGLVVRKEAVREEKAPESAPAAS